MTMHVAGNYGSAIGLKDDTARCIHRRGIIRDNPELHFLDDEEDKARYVASAARDDDTCRCNPSDSGLTWSTVMQAWGNRITEQGRRVTEEERAEMIWEDLQEAYRDAVRYHQHAEKYKDTF
jgi:hypothetical protein